METESLLERERRLGRPAAAAAMGAVVALVVGTVLQASAARDLPKRHDPHRHAKSLIEFKQHAGADLGGRVAAAVAAFLVLAALLYLYRCARGRRPETPTWIVPILIVTPVLVLAGGLITHFQLLHTANDFLASGPRTDRRAKHLTDSLTPIGQPFSLAGSLASGLSFVLVSMNAMRAGLLTRFLGILGVIAGVLFVLGFPPIVEMFWLVTIGALFLGYWPGGRGPAWESGRAEPWPTAAELRAAEEKEEPAAPEPEQQPAEPVGGSGRTRKRKRKRRR